MTFANSNGTDYCFSASNRNHTRLTRDGQWMPYKPLRRMSWDELQLKLNPPEFINETIKAVRMHPDHGQVLKVTATSIDPDSYKLSGDRIAALGSSEPCP